VFENDELGNMSGNFKKIVIAKARIPTLCPYDRVYIWRNVELIDLVMGVGTSLPKFQELWRYDKVQVPF
jgi:hypothetical protein